MTSDGIRYSNIEPDHDTSAAPRPTGVTRGRAGTSGGPARRPWRSPRSWRAALPTRADRSSSGSSRILGDEIADRQEAPLGIEEEVELHGLGHGTGGRPRWSASAALPAAARRSSAILRRVSRRRLSIERGGAASTQIQHGSHARRIGCARRPAPRAQRRRDLAGTASVPGRPVREPARATAARRRDASQRVDASSRGVTTSGAPVVGQRLQRLARERQRCRATAGDALTGRRSGRATPRRHWRARADGRRDCRCRPTRRRRARAARRSGVSYQL